MKGSKYTRISVLCWSQYQFQKSVAVTGAHKRGYRPRSGRGGAPGYLVTSCRHSLDPFG
jgi:hypothetical protein